jgi:hypothetical protein
VPVLGYSDHHDPLGLGRNASWYAVTVQWRTEREGYRRGRPASSGVHYCRLALGKVQWTGTAVALLPGLGRTG